MPILKEAALFDKLKRKLFYLSVLGPESGVEALCTANLTASGKEEESSQRLRSFMCSKSM